MIMFPLTDKLTVFVMSTRKTRTLLYRNLNGVFFFLACGVLFYLVLSFVVFMFALKNSYISGGGGIPRNALPPLPLSSKAII